MIVEITGVSTQNKGAELMLAAVAEHLRARGVQVAVQPGFGTFEERARYGLRTKLPRRRRGLGVLSSAVMPSSFRRTYGLVTDADVDAVLDASGFAFGDQLSVSRVRKFAEDVAYWKTAGKPVILLPQALGPFARPGIRSFFERVLGLADAVYARDTVSYEHASALSGAEKTLRVAPDFTPVVASHPPDAFEKPPRWACVVPNHRMVEKTDEVAASRYVPFLADCVRELERAGYTVSLLLHDTVVDGTLVEPVERELGREVHVVREADPRSLKGYLGLADLVVASRFHALVGSLSQGVPSIGAGWSHKYGCLFDDFGCPEMLLAVDTPRERLREVVERVKNESSERSRQLRLVADDQRRATLDMWDEVDGLLGLPTKSASESPPATASREEVRV